MQPEPEQHTVTIPLSVYMGLFRAACLLDELNGAGVDNWGGYGEIDRDRITERSREERARMVALSEPPEPLMVTFTVRVSSEMANRIRSFVTLERSISDILRAGAEMWIQANETKETPA